MKFAWIENNAIKDVCQGLPSNLYTPEVAAYYTTQVPDDAINGDGWINNQLIKPAPQPLPPLPTRKWTINDFRSGFTLAEKTKWDNDSAPEIVTVKNELPQELAGATELLDFLVESGVISQASADKILAS